jgi:hypothetical protein
MKPYAYVIVRKDLPPVQIVVQACHAAQQAGHAFEDPVDTSSIILLQVPDQAALEEAAKRLDRHKVSHRMFYEPDFGPMGYSALATRPLTRKKERFLFANYEKLAM